MSIEAVVGRIDQIVAMQQQLADPGAAAASSSSSTAGTIPGTTSTGTGAGSFTDALNSAMGTSALGAGDPATGTTGALTPALKTAIPGLTGNAPAQVQAMTNMANALVGKPYTIGGGHGGWGPQSGYDCSGFVSAVLHAGGYLNQPVDTTALPNQAGMEAGPGQYVTVYDRALPGQSGHVIIEINGQFYESGGSHGAWGGGGGVEKIGTPSAAYLASFPTVLHPSGL
jgi:cell wall-associated NlpC family hydrolase